MPQHPILLAFAAALLVVPSAALGVCPTAPMTPFYGRVVVNNLIDFYTVSPNALMTASAPHPPGQTCSQPGFIFMFLVQDHYPCVGVFGAPSAATPTASGCQYTGFHSMNDESATVDVRCGTTEALQIDTVANFTADGTIIFTGYSSVVCPTTPPAPAFTLVQTVCSDASCTQNCVNYTRPQGVCVGDTDPGLPATAAEFTCLNSNVLETTLFVTDDCTAGSGHTVTAPTGVCVRREFFSRMNYCVPNDAAASGKRRRTRV